MRRSIDNRRPAVATVVVGVLALSLSGCYLFGGKEPPAGMRTFGGAKDDTFSTAVKFADESILVVGDTWSLDEQKPSLYLVKLDPLGGLLWEKAVEGDDHPERVLPALDGGAFILAKHVERGSLLWGPIEIRYRMLQVDGTGSLIWAKNLDVAVTDVLLVSDPAGKAVVCERRLDMSNDSPQHYLIVHRYTDEGTESQTDPIPMPFTVYDDVQMVSEDSFVFGGTQITQNGDTATSTLTLVCFTTEGQEVWQRRLDAGTMSLGQLSMLRRRDGSLLAAVVRSTGDTCELWMVAVNVEGELLGEQRVVLPEGKQLSLTSISETADGSLLLAGANWWEVHFSNISFDTSDAVMAAINPDGGLQWWRQYGWSHSCYNLFNMSTDSDWGVAALETQDAGCLLVGTTQVYGHGFQDGFTVTTDAQGNIRSR